MPHHPFSQTGTKVDAAPAPAATVILLRDAPEGASPFEIFLLRRSSKSAFMAGAHVFPGGRLDDADASDDILGALDDAAADRLASRLEPTGTTSLDRRTALGLYVAACRELFEEAGVLLAREKSGAPMPVPDARALERYRALRYEVHDGTRGFADVLEADGLVLDLEALAYLAHWVTPSFERRRFDARFFLTRIPEGQVPLVDHEEAVAQAWLSPGGALAAHDAGKIVLPPPTLRTVEELAMHKSIDAALAAARARTVAPVLPKVGALGEAMGIVLPWDPVYDATDGEALEGLPSPHPMSGGPSRIVIEDGRWVSRSA